MSMKSIEIVCNYLLPKNATEDERMLAEICADIVSFSVSLKRHNAGYTGKCQCLDRIDGACRMFIRLNSESFNQAQYITYKSCALIERILAPKEFNIVKTYTELYTKYMRKI